MSRKEILCKAIKKIGWGYLVEPSSQYDQGKATNYKSVYYAPAHMCVGL